MCHKYGNVFLLFCIIPNKAIINIQHVILLFTEVFECINIYLNQNMEELIDFPKV